jgi:hypothetical protein
MENGITHGLLRRIFKSYQRWVAEGMPKYGYDYDAKKPSQYYYDPYHDNIQDNDNGIYSFNIQTYDSPDGDTWWRGTFKLIEGRVSIIEQSAWFSFHE